MYRGRFLWTPTPPSSGQRTPRLGPARVCVCALLLAGSGSPASKARSGAPHLSCGRFVLLLCLAPPRLGSPLSCLFVCLPPNVFFVRLRCLRLSLVSGPGCPGPWRSLPRPSGPRSLLCPSPPPFFFLSSPCAPGVCGFLRLPAPGPCPPSPSPAPAVFFFPFFFFPVAFLPVRWVCRLFLSGLPCLFPPPLPLFFQLFLPPPPPLVCSVGLPLLGSPCAPAFFLRVLCCAVQALRVVPCLWQCCQAASFGLRSAVVFWSVVPCAVPRCVPGCGAALRCCASLCPALSCFVPCCVVSLVRCRCLLCYALARCLSPCSPLLSGGVF